MTSILSKGKLAKALAKATQAKVLESTNKQPLKNLEFFQQPRIALNRLKNVEGSTKQRIRVGRGRSCKRGKTSGFGDKGAGQHMSLRLPYIGFEGGQTPIYKTAPKMGPPNPLQIKYEAVNLNRIMKAIEDGKINPNNKIDIKVLWEAGACSKQVGFGIKLLATGAENLKSPLDLEVTQASRKAIEAIEKAGGKIQCVYHNKLNLKAILKPQKFLTLPRPAFPNLKLQAWYKNPDNRGYLVGKIEETTPVEQTTKLA